MAHQPLHYLVAKSVLGGTSQAALRMDLDFLLPSCSVKTATPHSIKVPNSLGIIVIKVAFLYSHYRRYQSTMHEESSKFNRETYPTNVG